MGTTTNRGVAAILGATLFGAAGCASPVAEQSSARGPVDTGTYPNLNIPPPVATTQFDRTTLAEHKDAIRAAKDAQRAEGDEAVDSRKAMAEDAARLRRLQASHVKDTLTTIERR